MNTTPEWEALVQRYIDGSIQADELAVLNARLANDADARRVFCEWLNLDSAMAALAADHVDVLAEPASESLRVIPMMGPAPRLWQWMAAAACLIFIVGGAWWRYEATQSFAVVVKEVGASEFRNGARLRSDRHVIAAGSVELLTTRGARLVIEAPAEFRFESAQRLRMTRGRLAAEVPPAAKGFTVITPSGDAVDLGTRFGVDVPEHGAAEIHVFQGEVIAKASGAAPKQNLRGGDAVRMDFGASSARELRSSAFIQPDEMQGLTAGLAAGQQARSEAALAALRNDPATIALLDFESAEPQPGVFRMVQGRWPGSRAPEFVHVGDHLKLDAGGGRQWPQLTLAAWVRLDRLGAPYQSLLHTDGWSQSNPGQVHWMVTRPSTMRLALFGNTLAPGSDERDNYPDSRTPVLPEQGRWVHVATVYDADARTVRFYLNGRFDKETRHTIAHPARLGPAQIGNWDRQDRKLSGRVDELILLGRTMSDAEVQSLFEAGNPYR